MNGTGGVTVDGAAVTFFTGTNSYTGGTTVTGAGLRGNTDSVQGNITNSTLVTFDQTTTGTYAGT